MDHVIHTQDLRKSFGRTVALDGLDLVVERGQVHGFLGPNGAGKSTTIRLLLGLLRKDGGTASVLGAEPWRDAVALHRHLSYVPGDVALWPTLSGGEAIDLLCALRGTVHRARRDALVERFALDPTKRCASYSKGNRQKVAIVAGLAAEVDLYLLDEPTSGLDPLMETVFRDVVRDITAAGGTVLLSSHILAEAEALCDAVSIIRAGRIVETGRLSTLRHLTRIAVQATTRRPLERPETWPGVVAAEVSDGGCTVRLEVEPGGLGPVVERLAAHDVTSLTSAPPTLEELFLRHYGDELAHLSGDREPAVTR